MKVIRKVGLAVFQDQKILMAHSHKHPEAFFNLGGKFEAGESDLECLAREVREEAGVDIKPGTIEFLAEFEAPAHGKTDTLVNTRLYRGELAGEPVASSEIAELAYFDSTVDPKHLTAITQDHIFPWLKARGLIR